MKIARSNAAAFCWGMAEATVFFIVPDVLLSWFALQSLRKALVACVWALIGALIGGFAIWLLGLHDVASGRAMIEAVPAISDSTITGVRSQLETSGLFALFLGPLTGTPYKIYALEAGSLGFGPAAFLLVSIPARVLRFVAVSAMIAGIGRLLASSLSLQHRRAVLVACWIAFYAWYLSVMEF